MKVGLIFTGKDRSLSAVLQTLVFDDDDAALYWQATDPVRRQLLDAQVSVMPQLVTTQAHPVLGSTRRVRATFVPQTQIMNGRYIADCEGVAPAVFDVTEELIAMGREAATSLADDELDSDALRYASGAPQWVVQWSGPFRVLVPEQEEIDALFRSLAGSPESGCDNLFGASAQ